MGRRYLIISKRDIKIPDIPGCYFERISRPEKFTLERVQEFNPERIFIPFWSWKVPKEIHDNYECIAFHMTDLPYGRGGTPLQNLILDGKEYSKVTAFRVTEEYDAGPIYLKSLSFSLNGNAEFIYNMVSELITDMIEEIIEDNPQPYPQHGKVTIFKRRKPCESDISKIEDVEILYDYIRMLDADDYPSAYLRLNNLTFRFRDACLMGNTIHAKVEIEEDL